MSMDKYAVVTEERDGKTAAEDDRCPKCGGRLAQRASVDKCENCGTEPFEPRREDGRQDDGEG